jgi:hypothetical protein
MSRRNEAAANGLIFVNRFAAFEGVLHLASTHPPPKECRWSRPLGLRCPTAFLAGQEPLAAAFREFVDAPRRISAFRNDAGAPGEGIHTTDHRQHAIGLERCACK